MKNLKGLGKTLNKLELQLINGSCSNSGGTITELCREACELFGSGQGVLQFGTDCDCSQFGL